MKGRAYARTGRPVELGEELSRGGEAVIYRVKNAQEVLAKIYQPGKGPGADKLEYMVANPPANPTVAQGHRSIAWPSDLLYDAQRLLVGFTMPRAPDSVPILHVSSPKMRRQTFPGFSWKYLHGTARNLASAVDAVHAGSYVIGDINESNIMVSNTALVTLIDTDSFQVRTPKGVHRCLVGKPEYTAPELQAIKSYAEVVRTREHDEFGLAVIIFQLLMEGRHPFQSRWLPRGDPPSQSEKISRGLYPYARNPAPEIAPAPGTPPLTNLHPAVAELFQRCFEEGSGNPALRPSAGEWKRALDTAMQTLRECANGHVYADYDQRGRCPWCASAAAVQRHSGSTGLRGLQTALPPASPATAICAGCRHVNGTNDIYCRRCLRPLRGEVSCAFCLASMPRGAPYCPSCGVHVASGVAPCPRCGRRNQPGTIYCQRCARQLVRNEPCPFCRKPKPRGAPFCPRCGK